MNIIEDAIKQLDKQRNVFQAYARLLRQSGEARSLAHVQRVHQHIDASRHCQDAVLGDLLVQMYGRCGSVEDARHVFDHLRKKSVFSWNLIIAAYTQNGYSRSALDLFARMLSESDEEPDRFTFASVLSACSLIGDLAEGSAIHSRALRSRGFFHVMVQNALLGMYIKCDGLGHAKQVFERMTIRDVASWTMMIQAYAEVKKHSQEAIELFWRMECVGVKADAVAFASVLGACAAVGNAAEGRKVHERVAVAGFLSSILVGTSVVNMYAKCGCIDAARSVFDSLQWKNVVCWTAMITAYGEAHHQQQQKALDLFQEMNKKGMKADGITYAAVLGACSVLGAVNEGKAIHVRISCSSCKDDVIAKTALVNMYGKCGKLEEAKDVFESIEHKNVITWTAMITAFAENGYFVEARQIYERMLSKCLLHPNEVTFSTILCTYASLGELSEGLTTHRRVLQSGLHSNVVVQNALINLYGRCGSIECAIEVFDGIMHKDIVSWNAMAAAYSQHGHPSDSLLLYRSMHLEGVEPNDGTLLSVLMACSCGGMMIHFTGIFMDSEPTFEHYICMVDLLGRLGCLDDAEELVMKMPFEPNALAWQTLLGACALHCDVQRGLCIINHLNPIDSSSYVLIYNILTICNSNPKSYL